MARQSAFGFIWPLVSFSKVKVIYSSKDTKKKGSFTWDLVSSHNSLEILAPQKSWKMWDYNGAYGLTLFLVSLNLSKLVSNIICIFSAYLVFHSFVNALFYWSKAWKLILYVWCDRVCNISEIRQKWTSTVVSKNLVQSHYYF